MFVVINGGLLLSRETPVFAAPRHRGRRGVRCVMLCMFCLCFMSYFRSKAVKSFDPPRRFAGKDDVYNYWLRTNGVNTNGAAAKVMSLTDWGKRYALALLGI